MSHVRQQIREAAATKVTGLTTTGTRVYQSRVFPMSSGNLPGLIVYTKSESSELDGMTIPRPTYRSLSLVVEAYVKATADFDDEIDTISQEVEEALAADVTLGGLSRDVYLSSFEVDYSGDGEQPVAVATMTFTVNYRVIENSVGVAV
jgi:hypothetical protein